MLLVSGATRDVAVAPPWVGRLYEPHGANEHVIDGRPWACDNGCFGGLHPQRFLALLERHRAWAHEAAWLAVPDVVADAAATVAQWRTWAPWVADYGYRPAYVLQDGEDGRTVPWSECAAVFVGGSTDYKVGPVAERLCHEAHRRGKLVHVGRVNTRGRWRYCQEVLGAHSVDGSGFSKWGAHIKGRAAQWRQHVQRHPSLLRALRRGEAMGESVRTGTGD